MEGSAMKPRLWQWYAYLCSGNVFQVVGYDASSGRIQLKYFSGELKSIHETMWGALSLELRDPPEDWADPRFELTDVSGCSKQEGHAQEWMHFIQESPSARQPTVHANAEHEGPVWLAYRKSA